MACLLLQCLRVRHGRVLAGMLSVCLMLLSLTSCGAPGDTDVSDASRALGRDEPAPAAEELRGVWVAFTELNALLDGQTADGARAALDALFDDVRDRGLNAVFFHARANSDAYYASSVFPPAAAAAPLIAAGLCRTGSPRTEFSAARLGQSLPHRPRSGQCPLRRFILDRRR